MRRLIRGLAPWRALAGALALLLALGLQAAEQPGRAAIASAHPAATVAGLETLAMGGNAFDAAVAISAALAVVEPYSSGLGGGGFFLLREAGEKPTYRFIDARERAPLAAHADLYRRDGQVQADLSLNGPLAAAIPGLPAALVELAQRFGRLPLKDSLTPAIRLARDGVAIDRVYRERARWRLAALRDDPESARLFLDQGDIPEEYSLLRRGGRRTIGQWRAQGRRYLVPARPQRIPHRRTPTPAHRPGRRPRADQRATALGRRSGHRAKPADAATPALASGRAGAAHPFRGRVATPRLS